MNNGFHLVAVWKHSLYLTKSNNANLSVEPSADLANKIAAFYRKKIVRLSSQ